jgi:hypothetical protein
MNKISENFEIFVTFFFSSFFAVESPREDSVTNDTANIHSRNLEIKYRTGMNVFISYWMSQVDETSFHIV